jgi:hypothetical protein
MCGKDGGVGGHDQECTPGNSLDVAAEAENETRDKIYDARGFRVAHVFQVDDYRNFLAKVLADGGGIPEVSRAHYCDLDTVTRGELATRGFIVVLSAADVLGCVLVPVDQGVIIMLDETEPSTGVALHYAGLRRYEPVQGRRQARPRLMPETAANQTASTLTKETVRSTSTRRPR